MNVVNLFQNEKNIVVIPGGQMIFRRGDPCSEMYAVLEGIVEIRNNDTLIEEIPAGGIFGEMALVDGEPRSADAIAGTDVKLAKISEDRFMTLAQYNPYFTLEVLRITVERLRKQVR